MNLKDFEKGQKAYILSYGYGSRKEYVVECKIVSVGRKYVTTSPYPYVNTKKFEVHENYENALLEVNGYGGLDLLFKTKEDIEQYKELRELRRWLSNEAANWRHCNSYSLEQLRAVKEILEGGKTE